MSTNIDYSIPMDPLRQDKTGHVPSPGLIGNRYRHWKTKRCYRITGFVWDGECDLWLIEHIDVAVGDQVKFVRSYENFFGWAELGVSRMVRV